MATSEKRKQYVRDWLVRNREKARASRRAYYWAHRDAMRKAKNANAKLHRSQRAQYKRTAPLEVRQKLQMSNSARQRRLKTEVVEAYGCICVCCGENEIRFLTIDHINRDGKQHRSSGLNVYYDLIKRGFPKDGYRLLCMNCNWAMRLGDECPHRQTLLELIA